MSGHLHTDKFLSCPWGRDPSISFKSMVLGKMFPVTVALGVGILVLDRFVELTLGGGGRIL